MDSGSPRTSAMDPERARTLVRALSSEPLAVEPTKDVLLQDMNTLKEIRSYIQVNPSCIDILADEGIISVLLEKFRVAPDSNQVFLLQILASLGYVVQKSDERKEAAVNAGAFNVIVGRLVNSATSEGVILLGVQVISFLVDESDAKLRRFFESSGVEACLKILQRGCVRSSLLNARVATLLARMANLYPLEATSICCKLYNMIDNALNHIEMHTAVKPVDKLHEQVLRAMDDTLITLTQGLGLLLDCKPLRTQAVFEMGFPKLFLRLLGLNQKISPHLLETLCWTTTYAIVSCPELAKVLVSTSGVIEGLSRLVQHHERLDDSVVQAYASVVSHIMEGLLRDDGDYKEQAKQIFEGIISNLTLLDNIEHGDEGTSKETLLALHSGANTLRAFRRISKLGGRPLDLFISMNAFQVYIHLLQMCDHYPHGIKAEILQELGLLVENSPRLGLCLAKRNALDELKRIIMTCDAAVELCNATRALACFVEHPGVLGSSITDIALAKNCDSCLVQILCRDSNIDHEVLLNTVGALGYIVKRRSAIANQQQQDTSGLRLGHQQDTFITEEKHQHASTALVTLLKRKEIGESLTWNALWALIYLMNGSDAKQCTKAVIEADGVNLFTEIILSSGHNQPLACSAAKALYLLISHSGNEIKAMETLPLEVRLKVLTCATRSAKSASSNNEVEYGTLDLTIDPLNIATSSAKALDGYSGDELRGNGLKILYVSEQMEQVGIDAGGVRRDWLSRLSAELFDPKFSLFIAGYHPNDSVQISPQPSFTGMSEEDQTKWFRLVGRVLGLSILYSDPLGIAMVPSVCKLLLEEQPEFDDIKYISKSYYSTFSRLKVLRKEDFDKFTHALSDLTFTVNSRECMMKEAAERLGIPRGNSEAIMEVDEEEESSEEEDFIPSPPPRPPASSNSSSQATEEEDLTDISNIHSLSQLNRAFDRARRNQDRELIRQLLRKQNEMLEAKKNERKRRLSVTSVSSSTSQDEYAHKRLRIGEAKMKRMLSDLAPDGDMEKISPENFDRYLELLTFKLLVENVSGQIALIKQGFHDVIPRDIVLNLLSSAELRTLVEGDRTISVDSWKKHVEYKGGSEDETNQVRWFWEYVRDLKKEDRQKLFLWATGWRSIGRNGFSNRKFTIELTACNSEEENQRLPSVATCGFHLWLPKYNSREQLIAKFDKAMMETSFGNC